MVRKHFWYRRNASSPVQLGCTYSDWPSYVRRFFVSFPQGTLEWTHDEVA